MAQRLRQVRRAVEVTATARRGGLLGVLREIGAVGDRPATPERARAFRESLEELGTTFIKLGQLLSSRPDLLPDEYIDELSRLVDEVPPVPFEELEPVIAAELGSAAFVRIDPEPLATASIAQIHPALLADGRSVVVKVRRPGVEEQVQLDLELLRSTARIVEDHAEAARLLQLRALTDELATHLLAELDFVEEANNAELIASLVEQFDELVVPRVVRPHVTTNVLVLERVHGEKVGPDHGLPSEKASALARAFFRAYVRQVTLAGVYHADPHQGNVLLTPDQRLVLLDFGLLGRLDDDTRRNLALMLIAVAENRADDVANLILTMSLTTVRSDEASFRHELRRKLPRYHWRPLTGIRTGEALADLQRIAIRHGIALPTSFALVGKTLAQADAIARTLDPELDPIELLKDDAMQLMLSEAQRRLEPTRFVSYLYTQLEPLARMPRQVGRLVDRAESGTLKIGVAPTDLRGLEALMRSTANRLGAALIVAALLVSSALMARVNDAVALVGFVLSGAIALYMIWKIVRTPGDL